MKVILGALRSSLNSPQNTWIHGLPHKTWSRRKGDQPSSFDCACYQALNFLFPCSCHHFQVAPAALSRNWMVKKKTLFLCFLLLFFYFILFFWYAEVLGLSGICLHVICGFLIAMLASLCLENFFCFFFLIFVKKQICAARGIGSNSQRSMTSPAYASHLHTWYASLFACFIRVDGGQFFLFFLIIFAM